jgi:hypothetical protein
VGPDIYQIVMANLLAELTTDGQQMAPFKQPSIFHFYVLKIFKKNKLYFYFKLILFCVFNAMILKINLKIYYFNVFLT